jgi:two-component system, sensor histidine kinase ChiS
MTFSQRAKPSKRVLVADDDPVIRHLVSALIEREGLQPVVASDGGEAYRILTTDADFAAAVFDMQMPQLQGIEVIRFMRTEKRLMRIPVMMITSEPDLSLMANGFAAGVTLFLPKPFNAEQFQSTLRLLLSSQRPPARQARRRRSPTRKTLEKRS